MAALFSVRTNQKRHERFSSMPWTVKGQATMTRMPKYRNVKTVIDGVTFDSKREAKRWAELRLLERAGEIYALERQRRFNLVVNGAKICAYVADFVYRDKAEREVVEDVKSPPTRKKRDYRIKVKLMAACHGIEIREVL